MRVLAFVMEISLAENLTLKISYIAKGQETILFLRGKEKIKIHPRRT